MTLKYRNLSNGVMFPIYDPDTNLVYLCGKVGKLNITSGLINANNVMFFRVIV